MTRRIDKTEVEGILHLHSETGTEGGDWAIQDKEFIFPIDPLPPGEPDGPGGFMAFYRNEDGKIVFKQLLLSEMPSADWSYEGLYILKNLDYLFIFDKQDQEKIVWEGTIQLRQHEPFTEKTSTGMWIHADQEGTELAVWGKFFLEGYPAKLIVSTVQ